MNSREITVPFALGLAEAMKNKQVSVMHQECIVVLAEEVDRLQKEVDQLEHTAQLRENSSATDVLMQVVQRVANTFDDSYRPGCLERFLGDAAREAIAKVSERAGVAGPEALWPIYEFRPEPVYGGTEWLRYAKGAWIKDDGEWDVAFVSTRLHSAPIALYFEPPARKNILWSYLPKYWRELGPEEHPGRNPWHHMLREGCTDWGEPLVRAQNFNHRVGEEAIRKAVDLYGGANSRGPRMEIRDPWVRAGRLRRQDTKEVVRVPSKFNCMYCGEFEYSAK